jgi:hypothetical protein
MIPRMKSPEVGVRSIREGTGAWEFVEKRAAAPGEAQPDVCLFIELRKESDLSRPQICLSTDSWRR